MKIIPRVGVENIKLGMTKSDILDLLGEPNKRQTETFPDKVIDEVWSYENLEIDLSFQSDESFKLTTITIFSRNTILENKQPIGVSEEVLLSLFEQVELEDNLEETGKNYTWSNKDIDFWIVDGIVQNLTIFPEYDDSENLVIWPT